jgi:hypothetical protein
MGGDNFILELHAGGVYTLLSELHKSMHIKYFTLNELLKLIVLHNFYQKISRLKVGLKIHAYACVIV